MKSKISIFIMKWVLFLLLISLLIIDIKYKRWNSTSDTLFNFHHLWLILLLIFIIFSERISNITFSWLKGFSLSQSVNEITHDIDTINALGSKSSQHELDFLLERTTGEKRDLWSKLVIYRLVMRVLLRKICKEKGMTLRDTTAFTEMLSYLSDNNTLPETLIKDVEFIRDNTFFFEWGTGRKPDYNSVQRVIDVTPRTLLKLEEISRDN